MKITVLGCGSIVNFGLQAGLTQQAHEVQGWLAIPQPDFDVNVDSINVSHFNNAL